MEKLTGLERNNDALSGEIKKFGFFTISKLMSACV